MPARLTTEASVISSSPSQPNASRAAPSNALRVLAGAVRAGVRLTMRSVPLILEMCHLVARLAG